MIRTTWECQKCDVRWATDLKFCGYCGAARPVEMTDSDGVLWGAMRTLLRDAQTSTAIADGVAYLDSAAHVAVAKARDLLGVDKLQAELADVKRLLDVARDEAKEAREQLAAATKRAEEAEARMESVIDDRDALRAIITSTTETTCSRTGHADQSATCITRNDPKREWCRHCLAVLMRNPWDFDEFTTIRPAPSAPTECKQTIESYNAAAREMEMLFKLGRSGSDILTDLSKAGWDLVRANVPLEEQKPSAPGPGEIRFEPGRISMSLEPLPASRHTDLSRLFDAWATGRHDVMALRTPIVYPLVMEFAAYAVKVSENTVCCEGGRGTNQYPDKTSPSNRGTSAPVSQQSAAAQNAEPARYPTPSVDRWLDSPMTWQPVTQTLSQGTQCRLYEQVQADIRAAAAPLRKRIAELENQVEDAGQVLKAVNDRIRDLEHPGWDPLVQSVSIMLLDGIFTIWATLEGGSGSFVCRSEAQANAIVAHLKAGRMPKGRECSR